MPDHESLFRSRVSFTLSIVVAISLAAGLLWVGRVIFLLLFASVIGAVLLTTVSDWLHKRFRMKQGLALTLFLGTSMALVGILIWLQGPNTVQQFALLEVELPQAAHKLLAQVQSYEWGQWLLHQSPDPGQVSDGFNFAITRIGGIVVSSATVLAGLVIVVSLSIYFSAEPGLYYNGLRRAIPAAHRATLDACAASIAQILRWWVLAKLISMSMVGILISVGLGLIGVPLAGTLGIIAAAMTFIPNVGPLISVIPATLLALAINPTKGLLTLLVFAVVFTLEGYVVTPLLERNIVRLPPALTLIIQLLLAAVAGPIGVALAAPIAAAALGALEILLPEAPAVPVLPEQTAHT